MAGGSEVSWMEERTFSAELEQVERGKEGRAIQGRSSVTNHACWNSLFSVEKNDLTSGKGKPTLKGKDKSNTGTEMAPSTLRGPRCWL